LLFVGGDFARKGGHALVDVFRERFAGRCELDIVTRDEVSSSPGIRVHRAEANSAPLKELYANADLFVLPTRAEAFGISTIEAMASGLPVIVSDVGGARDIVEDGVTGWLVGRTTHELAGLLSHAVDRRSRLREMGRMARQAAEERFDGKRNDGLLVETLVAAAAITRP